MRKVKILKHPEMKNGGATQMFGAQTPPVDRTVSPGPGSYRGGNDPEIKLNRTLKPTTKENATLEAEVEETIVTNYYGDGIPEFYKISGKRHYKGGTYLNAPENSFIFSRDKSMKIDDPELLKMFGKSGNKKSYTPAELSKSYDLNKYKEILLDPSSTKREKDTAEQMIKNYNLKLGALALVQESIKGFDGGIPKIAMPYLESVGIDPTQFVNPEMGPTPEQMQTAMYGKEIKSDNPFTKAPMFKKGGQFTKYQTKGNVDTEDSGDAKKEKAIETAVNNEIKKGRKIKVIVSSSGRVSYFDDRRNQIRPENLNTDDQFVDGKGDPVHRDGSKKGTEYIDLGEGEYIEKAKYDQWVANGSKEEEIDQVFEPVSPEVGGDVFAITEDGGLSTRPKIITKKDRASAFEGDVAKYLPEGELTNVYADAYANLAQRLETDQTLRDQVFNQYKQNINSATKNTRANVEEAAGLSQQEVIDRFLNAQKHFLIIQQKDLDYKPEYGDTWQRNIQGKPGYQHPKGYLDAAEKAGLPPLSNTDALVFQTFVNSANDLIKEGVEIPGFVTSATGFQGAFSPEDGFIGGKTGKEGIGIAEAKYNYQLDDIQDPQIEDYQDVVDEGQPNIPMQGDLPWHTQDLVNLYGAQQDLASIKKYRPFRPALQFDAPEFAGVDFRGAASRLSSGVSGAAEQLGQFAGPQSFNARMSDVFAKNAQGIADLRQQEYATNQGMLNQFNSNVAQMRNQNAVLQSNLDKRFYDENATANQQFDNTRRMVKGALRQAFNQGITNVDKTKLYNEMYDDFDIIPGGRTLGSTNIVRNQNPSNITADNTSSTYNQFGTYAQNIRESFPNATDDAILSSYYKDQQVKNKMYSGNPIVNPSYNYNVGPQYYDPRYMRGNNQNPYGNSYDPYGYND